MERFFRDFFLLKKCSVDQLQLTTSMATLLNCGFAREVVLSGISKYHQDQWEHILRDYNSRFKELPTFAYGDEYKMRVKFQEYAQFIQKKKVNVSFFTLTGFTWVSILRRNSAQSTNEKSFDFYIQFM